MLQYHSIDGGCPDEWDGGETYEEADLVSVVVSDGFEEPEVTTRKPTSAPVVPTPMPTSQYCCK